MKWEEKFCSCAEGLFSCGETSSWNSAAGKAAGTGLSAATQCWEKLVVKCCARFNKVETEIRLGGKSQALAGNTGERSG